MCEMVIKIKGAKIKEYGNSYFILVPMDFIKNEMINPLEEYDIVIKPAKKDGDDNVC